MIRRTLVFLLVMGFAVAVQAQGIEVPGDPDNIMLTADGTEVHEYDVTVWRVGREHITVSFSNGERGTYKVPRDFRFNIDGEETPLSGIYPRQELQVFLTYQDEVWVLVDAEMADGDLVVIEEVAIATQEGDLVVVEEDVMIVEDVEEEAPMMPKTAGPLPLIGLSGLLLVGLAGGLRRMRKS